MSVSTGPRTFIGANIRGTPPMPSADVAHDLRVLRARSSVIVTQEMRWPWYWRTVQRVMVGWASAPTARVAVVRPTYAAQGVLWDRSAWRRRRTRQTLLHAGVAGISEDRRLRAVLLEDRATRLSAWFATTHFVVGGDRDSDSVRRRQILADDIARWEKFMQGLRSTGRPVVCQLDANIAKTSPAYLPFTAAIERLGGRIVGEHGIEYTVVLNGRQTRVAVDHATRIPATTLRTDHEARVLTFRLTRPTP